MVMSHVCLRCGRDLTRVRANRDPQVPWPIVTCPECGGASVRRRHPVGVLLRWLIRLDAALTGVAIRLVTGLVVFVGASVTIRSLLENPWPPHTDAGVPVGPIALMAGSLIALGTWVAIALAHWRWWLAWPAVLGLLGVLQMLPELQVPMRPATLSSLPRRLLTAAEDLAPLAADLSTLLPMLLPVMLVGILPALVLRWLGRAAIRRRFRWYRGLARRGRFIPG